MAALEKLRKVCRHDRQSLGRHCCLLRAREQSITRICRRAEHQDPRHPTTRVRFARRGKSAAQNPHLHATRTLMPSSHLWPKCSIALAAVKDKPTGGASAPSLTAAARDGEWSTMAGRNGWSRDKLKMLHVATWKLPSG